jgi:hypothetical protein
MPTDKPESRLRKYARGHGQDEADEDRAFVDGTLGFFENRVSKHRFDGKHISTSTPVRPIGLYAFSCRVLLICCAQVVQRTVQCACSCG